MEINQTLWNTNFYAVVGVLSTVFTLTKIHRQFNISAVQSVKPGGIRVIRGAS